MFLWFFLWRKNKMDKQQLQCILLVASLKRKKNLFIYSCHRSVSPPNLLLCHSSQWSAVCFGLSDRVFHSWFGEKRRKHCFSFGCNVGNHGSGTTNLHSGSLKCDCIIALALLLNDYSLQFTFSFSQLNNCYICLTTLFWAHNHLRSVSSSLRSPSVWHHPVTLITKF